MCIFTTVLILSSINSKVIISCVHLMNSNSVACNRSTDYSLTISWFEWIVLFRLSSWKWAKKRHVDRCRCSRWSCSTLCSTEIPWNSQPNQSCVATRITIMSCICNDLYVIKQVKRLYEYQLRSIIISIISDTKIMVYSIPARLIHADTNV